MANINVAVIYYSTYGTNHQVAQIAAKAAREAQEPRFACGRSERRPRRK